jgi:hypothetical protein
MHEMRTTTEQASSSLDCRQLYSFFNGQDKGFDMLPSLSGEGRTFDVGAVHLLERAINEPRSHPASAWIDHRLSFHWKMACMLGEECPARQVRADLTCPRPGA